MRGIQSYLEKVKQRLAENGFEIKRRVSVPPYQLNLVAGKSSWELSKFGKITRFVLATSMDKVDIGTLQDFSSRSTKYALDNRGSILPRGFGGSLFAVPAIISEDFEEALKKSIEEAPAKKHWAAFEFPVLISLKDKRMYYCKKTHIWGAAYHRGVRKFVEKHLAF